MTARHILLPVQTLAGGGVERVALRLAGAWIAAGRRVTILAGTLDGPLAAELPAGVETIVLDDRRYRALCLAAPDAVRRARPDAIFCPGNHYTAIAAWTRLRLGRACPPIAAKVSNALVRRDMPSPVALGYRVWLRLHPRFLDAVVAMTPAMADQACSAMRLPPGRLHVIANPPAPRSVAAEPGPPRRALLGVGRLARQKRWDRAIAALPRLADRDAMLIILGEGTERPALEALARRLGVADRVHLPGYCADPAPFVAAAAAVVLTSDYEGVPGIVREALAAGTPVVATESSVALREMIPPGHGDVIAPGDEAALVAALDRRLAPGAMRAPPIPEPTGGAEAYLALFDQLVAGSRGSS